jgi:ATP-dependent Clp protease protease subunit
MKLLLIIMVLLASINAFSKTEIVLNNKNTVLLSGPVDSESVTATMVKLQELNSVASSAPIYMVLDTPGGSIFAGLELIEFARASRRTVHTINIFSASMGFQISQQLNNRYVTEFGQLMSHKARGGIEGEFPGQLDSRYAHILSYINDLDSHTVSRTKGKQTLQSYRQLYENEYWAKGNKAVKDGFADDVALVRCDSSLNGFEKRTVTFGPFVSKMTFSKCPMITMPVEANDAKNEYENVKLLRTYHELSRKIVRSY